MEHCNRICFTVHNQDLAGGKADDSEEMSYVEFERAAAENCAAITRYMIAHQ